MHSTWIDKRVLITGGLGFIGSNLAHLLAIQGAIVTIADSLIPEHGGNLFNVKGIEGQLRIHLTDIRSEEDMYPLIQKQDFLFNLAGQTCHLDSMENPYTDLDINCRAQISILEACRKSNPRIKILFASTRQVYGKPDYLPVDELHLMRPVDANGINKMAGECYHILYHNVYDIPTCVLRLTNTYGPRMRVKDGRQTFLGIWFRNLLENKPIDVWGGSQLRDYTYVDDATEAMMLAASSEKTNGKIFNLGGDEVLSLEKTAQLLTQCNGQGQFRICPFPGERKRIDIGDYYADFHQIQRVLSWEPKVSLREGFCRTLDYYRAHLQHYI